MMKDHIFSFFKHWELIYYQLTIYVGSLDHLFYFDTDKS